MPGSAGASTPKGRAAGDALSVRLHKRTEAPITPYQGEVRCEIAPIRHPAKRRRLKTVSWEIMYRAAEFVAHARKLALDCGRNFADHVKVFVALQERLLPAASP